jgi:hypothetical protein
VQVEIAALIGGTSSEGFKAWSQKHMRSLEGAAGAGLLIMVGLCGLLGFKAWSQGWPAIADGEFPLWSLRVSGVGSKMGLCRAQH